MAIVALVTVFADIDGRMRPLQALYDIGNGNVGQGLAQASYVDFDLKRFRPHDRSTYRIQ